MTKKEAYKIINQWLETHNEFRRDAFSITEYGIYSISLYYHILNEILKGSWKRLKWPNRRKTAYEMVIIHEFTKENPHFWTFKVHTARYARSGGTAGAVAGIMDFLIIKSSGNIYPCHTIGNSYIKQISQYLSEGVPEREWDIEPAFIQVENY